MLCTKTWNLSHICGICFYIKFLVIHKGVVEWGSQTKGQGGGCLAEGQKKKSDHTNFDGGTLVIDMPKGTSYSGVKVWFSLVQHPLCLNFELDFWFSSGKSLNFELNLWFQFSSGLNSVWTIQNYYQLKRLLFTTLSTVAQKTAQVFPCFWKIAMLWNDDVIQGPENFTQENTTS